MAVDVWFFHVINGLAGRWPAADALARLVVNDYLVPTSLSLILVVLWFSGRDRMQQAAIQAALSLLLANGLVKLCNLILFRPRPFSTEVVNLLFYRPTDSSFPSNPAAVSFALATAIWFAHRRAGAVMYVLAGLFALARVYCGVHYPLDVVGGALVGALAAYLVHYKAGFLAPAVQAIIRLGNRLYLA